MTAIVIKPHSNLRTGTRPLAGHAIRPAIIGGTLVAAVIAIAAARALAGGRLLPDGHSVWLAVHLASVIPALPVGAWVLARRKGGRLHRMLGRTWAVMMLAAALSSFGLHSITGGLSPIHGLSLVVLITVPRGVMQAIRGDIAAHRRTMLLTYLGLLGAGAFTFLPGRLLATWLVG